MNAEHTAYAVDVPPSSIQQWQYEESLNGLRRQAEESRLQMHWSPTGQTAIDATARAHIAEWLVIDVIQSVSTNSVPIVDALVHREVSTAFWDLYVVERHKGSSMAVRRLRDHRGFTIRWLEGRTPPPIDSTIGLRLLYLDPPGLYASTLPLVFGDDTGSQELLPALLRSFGANDHDDWPSFMGATGGRILLEYALAHLAQRASCGALRPFDDRLRRLHTAFSKVESSMGGACDLDGARAHLDSGRVAWIEDIAESPHILLFDDVADLRHYRRLVAEPSGACAAIRKIPYCRLYRACPIQLSSLEHALGALAGLSPTKTGLVRLERRDEAGVLIDPHPGDYRAARNACRHFSHMRRRPAA